MATRNPLRVKLPFALWTRGMVGALIWRRWRGGPSFVERWLKEEVPAV